VFIVSGRASPVILASIIASALFASPLGPIVKFGSQWYVESKIGLLEEQISTLNTELSENLCENESLASRLRINHAMLQLILLG
jgi:hypothetical protein